MVYIILLGRLYRAGEQNSRPLSVNWVAADGRRWTYLPAVAYQDQDASALTNRQPVGSGKQKTVVTDYLIIHVTCALTTRQHIS
jgi:hypothetical protein